MYAVDAEALPARIARCLDELRHAERETAAHGATLAANHGECPHPILKPSVSGA